ncbi:hypothetical protein TNCV_4486171 [Trichonephila clavipes]|nr:hypothetical protein TNCV_4486171 [Trichonephila clavipes]
MSCFRRENTKVIGIYCQQLERLKLVIDQKWPALANRRGVVFHQDNATPHTSLVARQKLWEIGRKVLRLHLIVRTWYQTIATTFSHCKTSRMIRTWDQEKIVKIDN